MIVLDVNVLAYLQSLGLLAKLKDVFTIVGGGHVSWNVYKQVKRSGSLGDLLEEWIDEGLVKRHNFRKSDSEGLLVREILRSRHAALVGKNVVDVECVALALALGKEVSTAVLTCDGGLQDLCAGQSVVSVDLFDVLSFLFCKEILDAATIELRLQPWQDADAGNGRPSDFKGSFKSTFDSRYSREECRQVYSLFFS